MAQRTVAMPQLGESVDEGTIAAWLKNAGDRVERGEPLLEVSTDKVDMVIESTVTGTVTRILVDEGDTVPVGTALAEIAVEGDEEPGESSDGPAVEESSEADGAGEREPSGSAPEDAVSVEVDGHDTAQVDRPLTASDLLLSPRVLRLLEEHEIDLDELAAFTDTPRVSRRTVEALLAGRGGVAGAAPAPVPPAATPQREERVVPFDRIRRLTAERMVASVATSPHVVTAIEVDFEGVAAFRLQERERVAKDHGAKLTWMPFIAWAVVQNLREFERLNASVRDNEALVIHPAVHLGVAVDLDGEGLTVPVLRDADELGLVELARGIEEFARKARSSTLLPDDVRGATFTISGQGPHGTLLTTAIINQPQVAIMSVDGIVKRPVVVEHPHGRDEIVAHHTGVLALAWDHRAIDGVYAARFLASVRDRLQDTEWSAHL